MPHWSGTATQLLQELESRAGDKAIRTKSWPSNARLLSGDVKRIAPNLRNAGIEVAYWRSGRNRKITLTRMEAVSIVTDVISVTMAEKQAFLGDDGVTQEGASDANPFESVTTNIPSNPDENVIGDASDADDAQIPTQSYLPEWTEV